MARKNRRKRLNKTKELYMFGRLVQKVKLPYIVNYINVI